MSYTTLFRKAGHLCCVPLACILLAFATFAAAQDTSKTDSQQNVGTSTDGEIVDYINKLIRQGWSDNGIISSGPSTEGEWLRRVYLDVLGRIPSIDEMQAFATDKATDKKSKLLNKLLYSDEYAEEYARNWTTIWTNILIGRTGGTDRRSMVSRDGLQQYLRRSFLKNKSYDQFVFELISADGANQPGQDNYNGAVNFILDNLEENAVPATAKTAKIFLGLQVQCTQCHNHPFNDWKQDAFWSMNAFFRQTKATRMGQRDERMASLKDTDFAGEDNQPEAASIFYELRNGLLKVAYPTFVDGTKINPNGYLEQVNRRDELAKMVRQSPFLGKAIVNRMWGHYMGYGFTKPVDDMGPHNPPTHPELLDRLGKDFQLRGYDLRQLTRWITLSDAYGLSSKFAANSKNKKDDPLLGEKPLFSRFYLRQMQAEELYESLLVATEAHKTRGSYEEQEKTKSTWLQQFNTAFGTDENDEATSFDGTIPQALMMMNGDLVKKATNGEKGSFLYNIAHSSLNPGDKITRVYMAALSRKPTNNELADANKLYVLRKGDAVGAMQDIFWAILNSNEFILNH